MAQRASRRLGLVDPINFNKARKAKTRADKEQRAQENRIKHGRTKAQKAQDRLVRDRARSEHDDKKRD